MAYKVPYNFIAGTRASAEEMNANFDYVTAALTDVDPETYGSTFCVNTGQLNSATGFAESLYHSGNSLFIRTNTVNGTDAFKATNAFGTTFGGLDYDIEVKDIERSAYASVVPLLDSAVSLEVSVAATSEDPAHECWQIFDGNLDSNWSTVTGVENAELVVSLSSRHIIEYYQIKVLSACNWTLYGSSDYVTWVELDSHSAVEPSTITRKLELAYNCEHYKLKVSDISGQLRVRVAELMLYEKSASGTVKFPETLYVYLKEDGLSGAARPGRIIRQATEPQIANLYDSILPSMTNNITPEPYVISASSNSPEAYMALDGKAETYWSAESTDTHPWIQLQVPTRISPQWLKLSCAEIAKAPSTGTLYGSNNGISWTPICSFTNLKWTNFGQSQYIAVSALGQTYSYFRFESDAPFSQLAEIQLYVLAESTGEYYLGEVKANDIWFKNTTPYSASFYTPMGLSASKIEFRGVPVGEVSYDASDNIVSVRSYAYNQNGIIVNAETTKEFSGNLVTYDSFDSIFREKGCTKLPNGLMLQWGSVQTYDTEDPSAPGQSVGGTYYHRTFEAFPKAFSNACLFFQSDLQDYDAEKNVLEPVNLTTSGFFYVNNSGAYTDRVTWFAIGW